MALADLCNLSHNEYGLLDGNNLTDTLSKILTLWFPILFWRFERKCFRANRETIAAKIRFGRQIGDYMRIFNNCRQDSFRQTDRRLSANLLDSPFGKMNCFRL